MVLGSELQEDDNCRCLPPQPRLLRTLCFVFSTDNLGARTTSNIETAGSHFSLSLDQEISLTVATQTLEVDSSSSDSSAMSRIVLISTQVRNNDYS